MAESWASVVLGGTRGIGAALARQLADPSGVLILGHLQDRESARALARELSGRARDVRLVEGNVADARVRERIAEVVAESGGRCRHLVHSVAVTSFKPLSGVRANQWDLVFAVSARSLVEVAFSLAEPLARARGAIVALSSSGSVRPVPSYGALGPAKAALEAAVRELAVELAPLGIRANAVRAGLVRSPVSDRFPARAVEAIVARTPLKRLGTVDEIASVARFLLEDDASWITGQVIEVDGGLAVT